MNDAPIQIRNPEVIRVLREVAARRGQPITQAMGDLARAELQRIEAERQGQASARRAAIREVVEKLHRLPVVGSPLTDADIYDEDGFPK